MNELISVIVPVYNVEKYICKCIDSIVNQTYKNLEIILIDDGSLDNCPQICDEYAKKDSRIKVIHKKNGGVSSARNMGIGIAKGEYIGFVDSDDLIHKDMYKLMLEFLSENNLDIVNCNVLEITTEDFFSDEVFDLVKNKNYIINKIDAYNKILLFNSDNGINPFTVCKLIKKTLLSNIIFNLDFSIGEDMLFCLDVIKESNRIGLLESKLYFYNRQEQSVTKTFSAKKITHIKSIEKIFDLDLPILNETKENLQRTSVMLSADYIHKSIYNRLENDNENIVYAREIIKKYYKLVKNQKDITIKNKIYIYLAYFCPKLYRKLRGFKND